VNSKSGRQIAADRLEHVPPYPFAAIGKRVRELRGLGHDVITLDIGSPDLPPRKEVIDALHNSAMDQSHHGYGGFTGIPELREAFAGYYARRFGVELDPDREVMPLIGSKEGIVNIALALVNPGDIVLVPNPGYIAYDRGAILAGGVPYAVRLKKEDHFLPALDEIPQDILKQARLLWINYPNNPTGAVASLAELRKIVDFCRNNEILLCSDNPYADVTFDGKKAPSIMQVPGADEIAVEFNSLSKTYNMAGWRVGVCVGNPAMIDALLRVKSNVDSGLFRSVQDAACVALNETEESWLNDRNMVYQGRRDVVMAGLAEAGLAAESPEAGLYVWAAVDDGDDVAYARDALEEAFVSVSAGSFYGSAGAGFVRLSLVVTEDRIGEAMKRLAEWRSTR